MSVYWSSWSFEGCGMSLEPTKDPTCVPSFKSSLSMVSPCMESGEYVLFSNIYAPIDLKGKLLVWNNIHLVRSLFPYLAWIVAGDFNAILDLTEK